MRMRTRTAWATEVGSVFDSVQEAYVAELVMVVVNLRRLVE